MEVVPFAPEHMMKIDKSDVNGEVLTFIGDLDQRAGIYACAGPAVTVIDNDIVLAIGGVLKFWQGVGEAWLQVSPAGRLQKMAIYKEMKSLLDRAFDEQGFHRIQAAVLDGHIEAHRTCLRLGFIPEGMMVNFGPNKENFIRYCRLGG